MSEINWVVARAKLYEKWRAEPNLPHRIYAHELGCSESWVNKWLKRLQEREKEGCEGIELLKSQSRAPQHRQKMVTAEMEQLVVSLRLSPHEGINRVPGPKTLLALLAKAEEAKGKYTPKSTSTIHTILCKHGCIVRRQKRERQPEESPA